MKVKGFQKATQKLGRTLACNSPTILTGIGVAGLITTVVMAVQATPKAHIVLEEEGLGDRYISKREMVRLTWRYYVPTAIMGGLTIACIIGANSINLRRNAALAGAYSLTEAALKEYQAKVIETIGDKKEQAIRDDIAKDRVKEHPLGEREVIITGKGDTLCFDVLSGRYFKSDIEKIRKIQNDLNYVLLNDVFLSVNDVYYALGLSGVKTGDDMGWDINEGQLEFRFSSQLSEDGTPCLVIDYHTKPKYDYRDY